jgi:WD40 repeat protein
VSQGRDKKMRNNFKTLLTIIYLLLGLSILCIAENTGKTILLSVKTGDNSFNIYMVYDSGKIKLKTKILHCAFVESYEGNSLPTLSPDEGRIVYAGTDRIIRLLDVKTGKTVKLTSQGHVRQVEALINGWSVDGNILLYHVMDDNSEEDDDEDDYAISTITANVNVEKPLVSKIPPLEDEKIDTGYFLYNVSSKKTIKINFNGKYVGWTDKGEIIYQYPDDNSTDLYAEDLSGNTRNIIKCGGWDINFMSQIKINHAGNKAAAISGNFGSNHGIVSLDLITGVCRDVTGKEDWAKMQWPDLSPSGEKISWLDGRKGTTEQGYIHDEFIVDGKSAFKADSTICEYRWIAEKKVALILCDEPDNFEIEVVDLDTGKIAGRQKVIK